MLQLFDTWAGVCPNTFDRFSRTNMQYRTPIKEAHPNIPIIAFPRGAALYLPELARMPEIDGVGIDYADPLWAARELQPHAAVQGNFDPILLLAGGENRETRGKLSTPCPHIFNLGHGILPQTPTEHVDRLIKAVRG